MKYKARPEVVEAMEWLGNFEALMKWARRFHGAEDIHLAPSGTLVIPDGAALVCASLHDVIVHNRLGFAVVNPFMFAEVYEEIES